MSAARELKSIRGDRLWVAFRWDESLQCRMHITNPDYYLSGSQASDILAGLSDEDAKEMYSEIALFQGWKQARSVWQGWLAVDVPILSSELLVAVQAGNSGAVRTLLQQGARADVPDETGKTAFDYGMEGTNLDVKLELLEGGFVEPTHDRHFTNTVVAE